MNSKKVLSYSYYEKLGFGNFENWSEDDFSRFLVWDFFNIYDDVSVMGNGNTKKMFLIKSMALLEKYNKYKIILGLLDGFFSKLIFKGDKKGNKKILLRTPKDISIIWEAKKQYFVDFFAVGKPERLIAIKNFIGYMAITELTQYFVDYLKDQNIKHLYQLVKELENKLRIINPDYMALFNDDSPIARALVLVSKKLGITTIAIQQGIYSSFPLNDPISPGRTADYVLVWGKYFKDLYTEQSIRKPDDIYILGYPYPVDERPERRPKIKNNHYILCYLAQDYESYNKDFLGIKLENAKNLYRICKNLGLKFIYRPHPLENRKMIAKNLPDVVFTSKNEKLDRTFKRADIFVSFSSTSLVEAAMRQKIALQLMGSPIETDNFEKLGACSKSFQTIEELQAYLAEIAVAPSLDKFMPKFNNDYIETRYNSGKRFLEILKEIEKRKNNEK